LALDATTMSEALRSSSETVLTMLTGKDASLECPVLGTMTRSDVGASVSEPFVVLTASLAGALVGDAAVLLGAPAGIACANLMLGADKEAVTERMGQTPNDEELDGQAEVANQLFGQLKTALREQHGTEMDVHVRPAAHYDPALADFEWDSVFEQEDMLGTVGTLTLADIGAFVFVACFTGPVVGALADIGGAAAEPGGTDAGVLGRVLDINLPLSVVVAEKEMKVEDVLAFAPGTVLEFEKASDSFLDLLVNDKLLAQGEAVRTGEQFGIRIVNIGVPEETIRMLGE